MDKVAGPKSQVAGHRSQVIGRKFKFSSLWSQVSVPQDLGRRSQLLGPQDSGCIPQVCDSQVSTLDLRSQIPGPMSQVTSRITDVQRLRQVPRLRSRVSGVRSKVPALRSQVRSQVPGSRSRF